MLIDSLKHAGDKVQTFAPKKKWYRSFCKRSAVAIIMREADISIEVLMIKRADREGDPWSGHMAFPGGVTDLVDNNNLRTARRETWEEIGLDTEKHTHYVGRLSDIRTHSHRGKKPMIITPHLFTIEKLPRLTLNHEVAEVIWVPLRFLANDNNRETMQWRQIKTTTATPCYFYKGRRIWGLSLRMLDELVDVIRQL